MTKWKLADERFTTNEIRCIYCYKRIKTFEKIYRFDDDHIAHAPCEWQQWQMLGITR